MKINYLRNNFKKFSLLVIAYFLCLITSFAQQNPWQVTTLVQPSAGYIKFDNNGNENFYLFDNYGDKIYIDSTSALFNSNYCKLLSNGYWSVYKDSTYHIYDQNMNFVESINFTGNYFVDVHDMNILPNGHYILICVENRTMDLSGLVEGGQENATVIGAHLYEVDKDGTVYWTWSSYEHYSILDVTPEIDLTQPIVPFTHANSVTSDLDGNILLSCRNLDEITKIDKNTGNIIWRWGGSACKNNQFTFTNDTVDGFFGFSHQHSLVVLPNGNYLLYDNGNMKDFQYSRAVEYKMDVSNKTVLKVWEYRDSPDGYYASKGSVQRLENGNTFINWGEDKITEVRPDKSIAFEMRSSVYSPVYRAFRYITRMNAVGKNIASLGSYSFDSTTNKTDISITVNSLNGQSYAMVEKHYYSPSRMNFSNNNFSSILPYRWVFSKRGITSITGEVRISLSGIDFSNDKNKLTIYNRVSESMGTFDELQTQYDAINNELKANFVNLGEFVIGSNIISKPILLSPLDSSSAPVNDGNLRWQKTKGAIGYKMQLASDVNFTNLYLDTLLPDIDLFMYKKLDIKTKYYWRVSALNNKDTSDWSDIFSFTTKIGPPQLLLPAHESEGLDTTIKANWRFISDSCRFWIQVSGEDDFSDLIYENKNINDTVISFSVNDFYRIYYWRVCSIEGSDTSQWSEIRNFVTRMRTPNILNITNNDINLPINGKITWDQVNGATIYHIQISDTTDFSNLIIDEINISNLEYLYKDLKYFTMYYVRIKASNPKDSSDWSQPVNFMTKLTKPTLLSPFNNKDEVELIPLFSWEPIANSEFFTLQISKDSSFSQIITELDSISTNENSASEFQKNEKVFWRVKAYAGPYESDWSDVWAFTTETGLYLSTPILLTPPDKSKENEKDGTLSWKTVNNAERYIIWISKNTAFVESIIDSNLTQNEYSYKNFEYDSTYYWKVKANNPQKESQWSKVFSFTIKSSGYVDVLSSDKFFSIYPQPANTSLSINSEVSNFKKMKIELCNLYGRKLIELNEKEFNSLGSITLNTSNLPDGFYILTLNSGTTYFSKKILVLHD